MSEVKNVKGIVLSSIMWNGVILKPKTEFSFALTKEKYDKLKNNNLVEFLQEWTENREIQIDAVPKVEELITEQSEQIIEQPIAVKGDDELVSELIEKREKIEEEKEKERQIAYERRQTDKNRPIPESLKKAKNIKNKK